jgi:hypothetical protein
VASDEEQVHGERAPLPAWDEVGGGHGRVDNINSERVDGGTSAAFLAVRLRRDLPDIAEELAAGIVHEPSEFVKRRDKALLTELTPRERRLVQQVMDDYPALTLAKTIAMLKAAGM